MYKKYVELRDGKGVTDYAVAKETGISKSTFSDWKNGRSKPKDALGILIMPSKALKGCTMDLLGYPVIIPRRKPERLREALCVCSRACS